MAICPNHGGYTGDSCKKCAHLAKQGVDASSFPDEELPKGVATGVKQLVSDSKKLPVIDQGDQLQYKKLESVVLKTTLQLQQAHQQLQAFANALHQKYDVDAQTFLNGDTLEWVRP